MSNEEVARALLEEGLTHVDGVVYMDSGNLFLFFSFYFFLLFLLKKILPTNLSYIFEKMETICLVSDAKMVLERHGSGYRVTPLALCGLPPEKRFTFYDQVIICLFPSFLKKHFQINKHFYMIFPKIKLGSYNWH